MAKHRKKTNSKVPAKGRLREMADRLWSRAVLSDWAWKCAVCGKKATEAHHLIPRGIESTRYDLLNGIGLCQYDHIWNDRTAPHQSAEGWIQWLESHQPTRREWLRETVENGDHLRFDGTKNADYYIGQILRLKQYVDADDFVRIVGVKFSEYLEHHE